MMFDLGEFTLSSVKARRKMWKAMTDEEKLVVVDAIIDRDAEFWKKQARVYCDYGYYLRFIDGGLALTERMR
jgi:hypothetical protein